MRQIAYWVGYFIFAFNDLENEITQLIAGSIDGHLEANQYAYIFRTGMQFSQKVELLERYYQFTLSQISNEELVNNVNATFSEIKNLASTRNTIVHANYYSLDKNGNIVGKVKFARGDVEEHLVSITKDFLVESHNKALELIEEVQKIDNQIESLLFSH